MPPPSVGRATVKKTHLDFHSDWLDNFCNFLRALRWGLVRSSAAIKPEFRKTFLRFSRKTMTNLMRFRIFIAWDLGYKFFENRALNTFLKIWNRALKPLSPKIQNFDVSKPKFSSVLDRKIQFRIKISSKNESYDKISSRISLCTRKLFSKFKRKFFFDEALRERECTPQRRLQQLMSSCRAYEKSF